MLILFKRQPSRTPCIFPYALHVPFTRQPPSLYLSRNIPSGRKYVGPRVLRPLIMSLILQSELSATNSLSLSLDRPFLHTPRVQKHTQETQTARPNSRFQDGFSAVPDIYFTSILIASVGREDDCCAARTFSPSGFDDIYVYSTLTYERKREPFKTRWYIQGTR